jgi:hypothetical protein
MTIGIPGSSGILSQEVGTHSHTMKNGELSDDGEGIDLAGESMCTLEIAKMEISSEIVSILNQLIAVFSLAVNLPTTPNRIEVTVKLSCYRSFALSDKLKGILSRTNSRH